MSFPAKLTSLSVIVVLGNISKFTSCHNKSPSSSVSSFEDGQNKMSREEKESIGRIKRYWVPSQPSALGGSRTP